MPPPQVLSLYPDLFLGSISFSSSLYLKRGQLTGSFSLSTRQLRSQLQATPLPATLQGVASSSPYQTSCRVWGCQAASSPCPLLYGVTQGTPKVLITGPLRAH